MNEFTKLAVIGLTAFAFSACNGNTSGNSEEVALETLADIGGYVVNVSSELLSTDDNFDVYFCYGDYYILNDIGDDYDYSGSAAIIEEEETSMNVWDEWPDDDYDVDIITAGTANPGYLVEGETYDLEEYDTDDVVGSLTVNVIETVDCETLPIPGMEPR